MKKNLLVTLGICAGLMLTACPKNDDNNEVPPEPPIPVVVPNVVDVRITTLLGENHDVPKIPDAADWKASIVETQNGMAVSAYCTDVADESGKHYEEVFDALFTADAKWNSLNSDDNTVEDAGYLYGNGTSLAASPLVAQFFAGEEDGTTYFNFMLYDQGGVYGGKPIGEDGHEVQWFEPYIANSWIYETTELFAVDVVNEGLGIEATKIPEIAVPETGYVYAAFEEDEDGPETVVVAYPGDDLTAFAEKAEADGFVVRSEQQLVDIDFDTFEFIYATYYTIFDDSHTYVLKAYVYEGMCEFDFVKFGEIFEANKTEDTSWSQGVLDMFNKAGVTLPFIQLGADYAATEDYLEEYGCYTIADSYYEDLTATYGEALVAAGFVKDVNEESDTYGSYLKDLEGYNYVAISFYYDAGNNIDIYPMVKPHLTEDTAWNKDVADALTEIGVELPFIKLGYDYHFTDEFFEEYGCYTIVDSHNEDLLYGPTAYGDALVAAGYELMPAEEDDDSELKSYVKELENGYTVYIDIYYQHGNNIDIYVVAPTPSYTVAEALALEEIQADGGVTSDVVIVTGTIKSVGAFKSTSTGGYYSNVVIEDGEGNELKIRTINLGDDFAGQTLEVGDTLSAVGYLSNKDGTITMGTANDTYAYVYDLVKLHA